MGLTQTHFLQSSTLGKKKQIIFGVDSSSSVHTHNKEKYLSSR